MPGVDADALELFIDWVYTDDEFEEGEVRLESLIRLYALTHKFRCSQIANRAADFIQKAQLGRNVEAEELFVADSGRGWRVEGRAISD